MGTQCQPEVPQSNALWMGELLLGHDPSQSSEQGHS